jgi:S-adenosylmethionine uptake transporter
LKNADNSQLRNLNGGLWLLADMSLNIFALTIVKALGLNYPATQLVFLRAFVGLLVILPWAIHARRVFTNSDQLGLHFVRVSLSALALTSSFFALSRLSFAMVSTISFTRPILTMIMAVIFLAEPIAMSRWVAAAIAFLGVVIAIQPSAIAINWGLPAMGLAVFFGTSAIIVTRKLSNAPTIVMMVFYAAGLSALTAPFALQNWVTITPENLLPLLSIGIFSQSAQFCFLIAHRSSETGFLAILGYFSFILSTAVGYFYFGEVPTLELWIGASLIIGSAVWITLQSRNT